MDIARLIMIVLLAIVLIQGVLFVVAPGILKGFLIRHPLLMNHKWIQNASDTMLRIYGVAMIVIAIPILLWILHTMGIF